MLGTSVAKKHMDRAAWRIGYTVGHPAIVIRCQMRAAHADMTGVEKGGGQMRQPMWVRISIVINIGDNLALSRLQTRIASIAEPAIAGADEPEPIRAHNGHGVIGGAIINNDDLIGWIV